MKRLHVFGLLGIAFVLLISFIVSISHENNKKQMLCELDLIRDVRKSIKNTEGRRGISYYYVKKNT